MHYLSRCTRKTTTYLGENKGAQPISSFVFATHIVQCIFFINRKFKVCVCACPFVSDLVGQPDDGFLASGGSSANYFLSILLLNIHTCTSKRVGPQVLPTLVTALPDNENKIISNSLHSRVTPSSTHGNLGVTGSSLLDGGEMFGCEVIFTFVLVFSIFGCTDGNRPFFGSPALGIGLTVGVLHLGGVS